MGLVDTSYQPWNGDFLGRGHRIAALARSGLKLAFVGIFTRLTLLMIYAIVTSLIGFLYLATSINMSRGLSIGNGLYSWYLNSGPYGMLLMLLTAMVGSRLISRDLKYNATAMYFSKAITTLDYVTGKFSVIATFLASATFVPSVALWIGVYAMGADPCGWGERLRDLAAIAAHSAIIIIPTSAIILALSSMSRTAYLPGVLYTFLYLGSHITGGILEDRASRPWAKLISLQNLTSHLGNFCYKERPGLVPQFQIETVMTYGWQGPAAILAAVTIASFAVVFWRLRKFEGNE